MQPRMLVVALVLSALPLSALAQANKPSSPVTVTNDGANPVPVTGTVSISNLPTSTAVSGSVAVTSLPTPAVVNARVSAAFVTYAELSNIYTNTGTRPIRFTGMSVEAYGPCNNTVPLVAAFSVTNQPGGTVGGPNTTSLTADFGPARTRANFDCLWTASFAGQNIVLAPGQSLTGFGEANNFTPSGFSMVWSVSGFQL